MKSKPHGEGLADDLKAIAQAIDRRHALKLFAGATLLPLVGCGRTGNGIPLSDGTGGEPNGGASSTGGNGSDTGGSGGSTVNSATGGASTGGSVQDGAGGGSGASGGASSEAGTEPVTCTELPEEVIGHFPADGSNGPNFLTTSGIVRSDIRSSFGPMTGTADGIPLTLRLNLVDASGSCAELPGYAIYVWHCDRDGNYSVYAPLPDRNYLRGVQATDTSGAVTFTTIFPGAYPGRWPHFHVQIFRSLEDAAAALEIKTSQLALPGAACNAAYATSGYETSASVFSQLTLTQDLAFTDGFSTQMLSTTGNPVDGFVATLTIAVAA